MSSYYYTYDLSGNVSSVVYTSNLTVSGIVIPTVPVYSYPVLSLSSLIYTPITISSYISLSGLFSGYSSYLSLSGVIASSNFFNYLTSSSYISPFTTNYTISSIIYSLTTTPYTNSTPWTKLWNTYLIGTLDISSTLIVRNNIICPNIIDQYSRLCNTSLSNIVYSNYLFQGNQINSLNYSSNDTYNRLVTLSGIVYYNYFNQGNQINSLIGSSVDPYSRLLNITLSNIVYSNYLIQGNQINNLTSSSIDPYSRLLNVSLSNIVYSNYLLEGNKINNLNFSSNDTYNRLVTLSGIVYNNYFTQGNLINNSSSIDSYSRLLNVSISNNVNSHDFRIGALEYKTTGFSYNGSTAINSNLYMGSSNNSIYMSDAGLYVRGLGDQNHYMKYNATRNGPCIGGYSGGSLGIAVPSYIEILGWNSNGVYINGDLTSNNLLSISSRITALEYKTTGFTYNGNSIMNSSIYLNNNALYLRSDTNHYLKYDSIRDGPQLQGYGGGSLGALNTGVYSEIIGYNNTSIQLNKPVYCNYNLIVTNDINCNGNLNHGYLYISSSGTYNLSMAAGYKYVFINASNVYINLGQGVNYTNIIYFLNLNGSNNVNYTIYNAINGSWLYSSLWCIWCPNNTWKYFTM